MTDVSDAQIEALEAARCRASDSRVCQCSVDKCGSYSVIASRLEWTAIAKAIGLPLSTLAALARGPGSMMTFRPEGEPMTDNQDKVFVARAVCRSFDNCECAAGECEFVENYSGLADKIAKGLRTTVPALAALARGEAQVVPFVLTAEMAKAMEHAPASGGLGAGRTFQDWWQPTWKVALSKSPYKGGA